MVKNEFGFEAYSEFMEIDGEMQEITKTVKKEVEDIIFPSGAQYFDGETLYLAFLGSWALNCPCVICACISKLVCTFERALYYGYHRINEICRQCTTISAVAVCFEFVNVFL